MIKKGRRMKKRRDQELAKMIRGRRGLRRDKDKKAGAKV